MRSDRYQIALIVLGIVATAGMGVFFYRELFPEYRIYQNDYVALEAFRSTYTGEPPPSFKEGIKQIVIEREDKGPAIIDRCISCHVALQFPHFSPTKVARDINGHVMYDAQGMPIQEVNEQYVWSKLDQKIAQLQDAKVNQQLISEGESAKVNSRLKEADYLASLKSVEVDGRRYDMTKVLSMHPLMGSETRPFEYHPIENYGCTSCHNGNGRGLTTEKAHGPVFDGQYEAEYVGYVPQFLEKDPQNDPPFSKIFNSKPGHELLFQTSPIYVGALIQAKCVQCHVTTTSTLQNAAFATAALIQNHESRDTTVETSLRNEKSALLDALELINSIQKDGLAKTIKSIESKANDYTLQAAIRENAATQLALLQKLRKGQSDEAASVAIISHLQRSAENALGSNTLVSALATELQAKGGESTLNAFLEDHLKDPEANGSIFAKMVALQLSKEMAYHIKDVETSFKTAANDQKTISAIASEIDLLTYNYHRGMELYISQACYACHRIAGFSRGGVGPELTQEGKSYPWYVKQKITWPQSDLKTSTMPNMKIDHEEVEDLVTFVLAQMGENSSTSPTEYRSAIQQWEAGRKTAWERPISPAEMMDLQFSMTVYATEGCAACHRLKGFESNVGFVIEKDKKENSDFNVIYAEHEWFRQLFPEDITGSQIVRNIDSHSGEIDRRIATDVRKDSILEKIERDHPNTIESFYTPFKFAARAKDTALKGDPKKLKEWKERVHNVLMVFIQEYGLGRLIGPRPNWSGVYHTDEWLMEHFHNPTGHVPRSIMPVLPFDDTKFYALTHMLDVLGIRNRNENHEVWDQRGFSPEIAYQLYCAQCHGDYKMGNGPIAEWIYPIPKNLGDGNFLRNLTKEKAIFSIKHGVKGTPMPPWGEAADKPGVDGIPVLTTDEISQMVDWLYSFLPSEINPRGDEGILKWKYTPDDAIKELQREGNTLHSDDAHSNAYDKGNGISNELAALPTGEGYFASLKPMVAAASTVSSNDYFDVVPNPLPGGEKDNYYIKRKFYTSENINEGKAFFEINCAVCHGKEADGAGMRAEAMHDAKPRMLTNLDWLNTHDDLRLLRSIKYGVPGTAMTPWGDFTSSKQRMQLVIFIRSLSESTEMRSRLAEGIYLAFDEADFNLERARSSYYPQLAALNKQLDDIQNKRKNLYAEVKEGQREPKEAVDVYQDEFILLSRIQKLKETDNLYLQMKTNLKKERDIFDLMGKGLIQNDGEDNSLALFQKALTLLDDSYTYENGVFTYQFDADKSKELTTIGTKLVANMQRKIDILIQSKKVVEGKISSVERSEQLSELNAQIGMLIKLKNSLIAGFEETQRLRQQQADLFEQLKAESKASKVTNL